MKKMTVRIAGTAILYGLVCGAASAFAEATPSNTTNGEKTAAQLNDSIHVTLQAPLMQPLFADFPVALVNGEPITLGDMNGALASSHQERVEGKLKEKIHFGEILGRLVTAKLIIQEAKRMGLDELPTLKNSIEAFARQKLRDRLLLEKTKDVKPSKKETETAYKELVKHWKVHSILFDKEADAKKLLAEIKGGKDFVAAATEAAKVDNAKNRDELIKPADMQPQIADVVATLRVGDLSPIIKVVPKKNEAQYVILKLLAIEYPETPELKKQAEKEAAGRKKTEVLKKFGNVVLKKNAKMNWEAINALDYNAKEPGLEKLLRDKRVLVTIKGEKPITIGELTKALQQRYFHGIEQAMAKKEANKGKILQLYEILEKKLFRKEALRLGLDKSEDYLQGVRGYEESLLFGAFIQKAVVPDVKLSDADIQTYYEENKGEFSSPEMIRMKNLVFVTKEQAVEALEKLRKGADFNWLVSNAEGQIDKSTEGMLAFEGSLLTLASLPEDIRKVVTAAKPGEARYYEGRENQHYVLLIQQVVPSTLEPLESVKGDITKKLSNSKLKQLVEDWAERLRESGDVEVFLLPASGT